MKKRYTLIRDNDHENVKNVRWFRPEIDVKDIRLLMEKSDKLALRDTLIWLGVMFVFCVSSYYVFLPLYYQFLFG